MPFDLDSYAGTNLIRCSGFRLGLSFGSTKRPDKMCNSLGVSVMTGKSIGEEFIGESMQYPG